MKSIKCPKCNLTRWADESACKRCKFDPNLTSPVSLILEETRTETEEPDFHQDYQNAGWQPDPSYSMQNIRPAIALRTGLALASMILGIVALPTSLVLVGLFLAPVALIFGIIALLKTAKNPQVYGGQGFAIAGVVTSSVTLLFVVPLIAAIAIPNLLAARRAANERTAIIGLRMLHEAEMNFGELDGTSLCGNLAALRSVGLIDQAIASGQKNGYKYEVSAAANNGCNVFATPVSKMDGSRSFMVSYDGIFRAANKKGLMADKNDPPLDD